MNNSSWSLTTKDFINSRLMHVLKPASFCFRDLLLFIFAILSSNIHKKLTLSKMILGRSVNSSGTLQFSKDIMLHMGEEYILLCLIFNNRHDNLIRYLDFSRPTFLIFFVQMREEEKLFLKLRHTCLITGAFL